MRKKTLLSLVCCVIRIVLSLKLEPQSNNRRARQRLHLHLFATFIGFVHGAFIMNERNEQAYTNEPKCIRTFDAQTFNFNCSLDYMQNAVTKRRIELSCYCVCVCFSRVRTPHIIIIIIFTFNATWNACFCSLLQNIKTTQQQQQQLKQRKLFYTFFDVEFEC